MIALALRGGGPDNITCVVADISDDGESGEDDVEESPIVVGAVGVQRSSRRLKLPDTPAGRAARLTNESFDAPGSRGRRPHRRALILTALLTLLLGIAVGSTIGWYAWAQQQYYVASAPGGDSDIIGVFRGPAQELFGFQLSKVVETTPRGRRGPTGVRTRPSWPPQSRHEVSKTRDEIVARLVDQAVKCGQTNPPAGCPDAP